jgi:hypothetical protein
LWIVTLPAGPSGVVLKTRESGDQVDKEFERD